jgi:hypothetical protein
VKLRRDASLRFAQVLVARTHGESVRLAHGRRGDNPDRQAEVGRHVTNDQLLLIVFLPEHGDIRLNQGEKACHDRRNAVEMAGPGCAAEIPCQSGHGNHGRLVDTEGIHGIDVRREQHVRIELLQPLGIALQRAWILVEVLAEAELRGIDEYAHHDPLCMLACEFDEAQVTCMQITHCRYKRDVFAVVAPALV